MQVGNKYQDWYVAVMARSLAKWGIALRTLTDHWRPEITNNTWRIVDFGVLPFMPALDGWWCKWALYSPATFGDREQIVFIDLDTLFLRDPTPILETAEASGLPLMFIAPWGASGEIVSTPLVYCDFRTGWPQKVYDELLDVDRRAPGWPGEDRFVRQAVQDVFGADLSGRVGFFPPHFMGRYKIEHAWNPSWTVMQRRWGDLPPFLTMAFNGKPEYDDVVRQRLPGWEHYAPIVEGLMP